MLKQIGFSLLLGLSINTYAATENNQIESYEKDGYQIKFSFCAECEFLDKELTSNKTQDTLQLEYEKTYFDIATGDEADEHFIDAIAYTITNAHTPDEPFAFALLSKRRQLNHAVIRYLSDQGSGTLVCIPPRKHNHTDIKSMLLTAGCQEAIERFNVPMSKLDIESLKRAKGTLN